MASKPRKKTVETDDTPVRVRAICKGFYKCRRYEGDEFDLPLSLFPASWVEVLDGTEVPVRGENDLPEGNRRAKQGAKPGPLPPGVAMRPVPAPFYDGSPERE